MISLANTGIEITASVFGQCLYQMSCIEWGFWQERHTPDNIKGNSVLQFSVSNLKKKTAMITNNPYLYHDNADITVKKGIQIIDEAIYTET